MTPATATANKAIIFIKGDRTHVCKSDLNYKIYLDNGKFLWMNKLPIVELAENMGKIEEFEAIQRELTHEQWEAGAHERIFFERYAN